MRVLIAAVLVMAMAIPASAAKLAFVLGNAGYEELSDLRNTHEDARAYAETFRALGFDVDFHRDLDLDDTLLAMDRFFNRVAPGDEVVFVYSGHGWSDGSANYLIPVDAPKQGSDRILRRRSVAVKNGLNGVLDELEAAGASLTVAIVDACRNNPFEPPAGRKSFAMSRGLAPVKAATGTFVIFSAGEGQEALDRLPGDPQGPQMSVFTRAFLPHLRSGIFLEDAISRAQVETASLALDFDGHLQHPAYYDQTLGDTCLSGTCSAGNTANADDDSAALCKVLYDEAKSAPSCFAFEGFLAQCEAHTFAGNARAYLRRNCDAPPSAVSEPKTAEREAPAPVTPDYTNAPSRVRIGTLLGFTGPIESLTGPMAAGAEAAMKEVSASRLFLGGTSVEPLRGDSTCIDSSTAISEANRLLDEGARGIVGADCSGVTSAVLKNVASKRGVVMVSPSATSPALTGASRDQLFYRIAPSDARFGELMSDILIDSGVHKVAVTYVNNDYGLGQKDSFARTFERKGGLITSITAHKDGQADYRGVLRKLSAGGARDLVIFGYSDQGGGALLRAAQKSGAFDRFHLGDGMSPSRFDRSLKNALEGSLYLTPISGGEGYDAFGRAVGSGLADKVYAPESYDAAAVLLLAMQSAGSDDPQAYRSHVERIANAPGVPILAGDLERGLRILAEGGEINYDGATDVEFIDGGDAKGRYQEMRFADGAMETVGYR